MQHAKVQFTMLNGAFLHDMGEKSTLVDFFSIECRKIDICSAESMRENLSKNMFA